MRNQRIKYYILLLMGLSFLSSFAQGNSDDFENTVIKIVQAFGEKKESTLNELISTEFGLTVIFRRGMFDQYEKSDRIDFNNPIPEYLPYFDFSTDFKLSFESLPNFNCDIMEWSKTGLFCDSTKNVCLLSNTAKNLKLIRNDKISEKEIESFEKLESDSRRVVLSDGKGGELVFYLTLINAKWYLTIIDRVTSDCSA